MPNAHLDYTSDYLASTQAVFQSGKLLKTLINSEPSTREYAITQLERAAQRHQTGGANYRNFMFTEAQAAPTDSNLALRTTEDVLATIMNDLNISNMLMASGQNVGELGPEKNPDLLDRALLAVGESVRTMETALPGPLTHAFQPGRFGFSEAPTPKLGPSADLATAIANYKTSFDTTIEALIAGSKDTVMAIVKALSKLDPDQVMKALGSIGAAIAELPKVGRLFRQGIELFKHALDSLAKLLGKDLLGAVKAQVTKIWEKLKAGEYIADTIKWAFGAEDLRQEIELALKANELEVANLDKGSAALAGLTVSFQEKMRLLAGISSAVSLAGAFLFLVPGVGMQLTVVAASIYMIVLAGVVLIGRDYTDSGPFKQVHGIREVTGGLLK